MHLGVGGSRPVRSSVLIVDDDASVREFLSEILEMAGYQVANARNGTEALRLIDETPVSVVLLDMDMPILDGRGFVQELARRRISLPVVLMTSADQVAEMATAVRVADFLGKPFTLPELLGTVERLSERSASE